MTNLIKYFYYNKPVIIKLIINYLFGFLCIMTIYLYYFGLLCWLNPGMNIRSASDNGASYIKREINHQRGREVTGLEHEDSVIEIQKFGQAQVDFIANRLFKTSCRRRHGIDMIGRESWTGDSRILEIILIKGRIIEIGAHRSEATRHLREVFLLASPRPLWIEMARGMPDLIHHQLMPQR